MNDNKILQQFHAMFGVFMVMFYMGAGILFLFFPGVINRIFNIDKAYLDIIGSAFLLYGLYRIYVTYKQIAEAFFKKEKDRE
jgi:hypothetical protein